MTPALIAATLLAVVVSLWIRRGTWSSWWEVGLSRAVALQGCALLLMSPWADGVLGPPLHRVFGLWNIEDLLGHLCLIIAAAAIVHHCLTRLAGPELLGSMFERDIQQPLTLGAPLLVAAFVEADEGRQTDLFDAHVSTVWLAAYWLLLGIMMVYLLGYAHRALLALRDDPRSRPTVEVFLTGVRFGIAACVIQLVTAWAGIDVSSPVWLCLCLCVLCFTYGAGRSWQAKLDWFRPQMVRQPSPPQRAS